MKKILYFSLTAMLILTVALSGCGGGSSNGGGGNPGGNPGDTFSIAESLVPGATSFPYGAGGASYMDDIGTCTSVNYAYYMAKYEVTYVLWKEVYDWGQSHGYTLNPGKRGGGFNITSGTEVVFDTGHESDPVTCINWYEAVVWCNALTEYYNTRNGKSLDCVYKNSAGDIIKNSQDSDTKAYLDGLNNNPTGNGFRLPTSMEWELAARYIGPNPPTVEPLKTEKRFLGGLYWTPGNYASGATGYFGNSDATKAAAWYFNNSQISSDPDIYSTRPVGQKPTNGNALGLYDMSGNVGEWCFDWFHGYEGSIRVYRGSYFLTDPTGLMIGVASGAGPSNAGSEDGDFFCGFRHVRTQ